MPSRVPDDQAIVPGLHSLLNIDKPGEYAVSAGHSNWSTTDDGDWTGKVLSPELVLTVAAADDADRRSRTYEMLREWAGAHPAEALRLIEEDRLESYTGSLAYAAIKGDPAIATAVMQAMDDHGERAGALQNERGLDSNHGSSAKSVGKERP